MADWDENSNQLRENLLRVMRRARDGARRREAPSLQLVRGWHAEIMAGLEAPHRDWVGRFRGETSLEDVEVFVGAHPGTHPSRVEAELATFIDKLKAAISLIDDTIERGQTLTAEKLRLVLRAAAWAHAEWVRIHPFANGNGRTARLWANWILMRYGIPPCIRLRPRPGGHEYAKAGVDAMRGDWQSTLRVFEDMIDDVLG